MTFLVHINDQRYAVADDSVTEVESRILDAVRAGGAFVEVHDGSAPSSRVLITSASTVRIQAAPPPIGTDDYAEEEFPDLAYLEADIELE